MDRINENENRIRGMDFIHHLFDKETVQELNSEYFGLLAGLNGKKYPDIDDELYEISREFNPKGLKYSMTMLITKNGHYARLVFRNKFIMLFPRKTDDSIKLCKLKNELIGVKNVSRSNGDLEGLNKMNSWQIKREAIDDEDFFEFEEILKRFSERIQKRKAAIKAASLYM